MTERLSVFYLGHRELLVVGKNFPTSGVRETLVVWEGRRNRRGTELSL